MTVCKSSRCSAAFPATIPLLLSCAAKTLRQKSAQSWLRFAEKAKCSVKKTEQASLFAACGRSKKWHLLSRLQKNVNSQLGQLGGYLRPTRTQSHSTDIIKKREIVIFHTQAPCRVLNLHGALFSSQMERSHENGIRAVISKQPFGMFADLPSYS